MNTLPASSQNLDSSVLLAVRKSQSLTENYIRRKMSGIYLSLGITSFELEGLGSNSAGAWDFPVFDSVQTGSVA
jgi:hypothetical protein